MAVTSLWRIHGDIKSVILYTENKEKTEVIETHKDKNSTADVLNAVINYAGNEDKTLVNKFVAGINCSTEKTAEEMMAVKKHFGKCGGVIAYHGYQSFREGEVTPEIAHEIGKELARNLWGDRYQVLVCTHLDKESHIHNHFIINTVSFVDGIKFRRTKTDYKKMQTESDSLCEAYGLSVIKNPSGKRISHEEYMAEKNGVPSKDTIIKRDIEKCMKESMTYDEFMEKMNAIGYTFDFTKTYTTISHPDFARPRRLKTLGKQYDIPAIRNKIERRMFPEFDEELSQDDTELLFSEKYSTAELPHIRFVYARYTFEINNWIERPAYNKYKLYLIKDDIKKLDRLIEEQDVLLSNNIDCYEKLEAFISECDKEMNELTEERKQLRNELKRSERKNDSGLCEKLKTEIGSLSDNIGKLRRKKQICESVRERAPQIEAKVKAIAESNKKIREEKEKPRSSRNRRFPRYRSFEIDER